MTASHLGQQYRLTSPPVRRVVLEIQFSATPLVESHHLWPFLVRAREKFAKVSESAPAPSDASSKYELIPDSDPWPIPRTHFDSGDLDMYIQGDELALGWDFGSSESPNPYVGFDALRSALEDTYVELSVLLQSEGIEVIPYHVRCFYVNVINEISGRDLVAGIVSDWTMQSDVRAGTDAYLGLRIKKNGSARSRPFETVVMVDSDEESGGSQLAFSVGTTVNEGETPFRALDEAHTELISEFRARTSSALREGWGE